MIRVLVFLIALALLAGGFAWMADRPGDLVLTWMGYRIETSLMVAMVALLVAIIVILLLWTILTSLWRAPSSFGLFLRHRREMKAQQAISRGLIAVGAGDLKLARRAADEAARLQPNAPLALLLDAQSAQMAGDRAGAERAFRAMTRRDETRLLGLRGLYIEAQRRNDPATARRFAEEAVKASPAALGWAGQAVLDERCAAGDWAGALDAVEAMRKGLDKADYRRKRAVLLTGRAQALQEIDRDAALNAALEAVKLAPDLVPAAALAGRRLAEAGDTRKARRILERAWEASPHPDIAEAYADVRLGDSARERLARMQKLADKAPGQREGALAVARAALAARDFVTARVALDPYLAAPTQRVAALMAEIEGAHGDTGRSREWMSRAVRASGDPVWTADGVASDHWLPVSPNGRLDGFEWRVPLAEIGNTRPVIEVIPPEAEALPHEPGALPSAPESTEQTADAPADLPASSAEPAAEPAPEPEVALAAAKTPSEKPTEPVIPLMRAPDDPGPGAAVDGEPEPGALPAAGSQRRHKIKDLFR